MKKEYLKDFKTFVNESKNSEVLNESSLSKVWRYIQDESISFGIVSASRNEYSKTENINRTTRLKNLVKDGAYLDIENNKLLTKEESKSVKRVKKVFDGYGYIELEGGFVEEGGVTVTEKSLFIPEITEEDVIALGSEFEQYSVIYKDSEKFAEIGTSTSSGIGTILNTFNMKKDRDNLTLNPEDVKDFFSALAKGSHRGRKFLFKIQEQFLYEYQRLSFNETAYAKKKYGRENSIKLL